jgi:hypothetical protein
VTTESAKQVANDAADSTILQTLARVGYGVNGLLHALIGLIAIGVVAGVGGDADQSGALRQVASAPGGVFVLWTIFLGLAALGVWLALSAFLIPPRDPDKKALHVVSELAKAVTYLALSGTALTFALGGSSSSSSDAKDVSSGLLAAPGGVVLIAAVGLGILAIGVYFVVKGLTKKFMRDITVPTGTAGKATVALGVAGYAAKGVAIGVVGILFVVAAFTADPEKATGLDGALQALSELPAGAVVLGVVGCGLIAYGAYCAVRAFRARL